MDEIKFSIIVPVYNRPGEVADLLQSLEAQTDKDFEIVLVEDGSTILSLPDGKGPSSLNLQYFQKSNEGRSIARNYGLTRAKGNFFVFVDSDCILPPQYIATLRSSLAANPTDCFGGPDAAHESFSDTQKAINYAMTSFLTTGGVRGGKVALEKFVPRTFNMGFSRQVYEKVGGFREMFGEDIDMSTRIRNAGFSLTLYPDVFVYHKRRVNFKKFCKQMQVFGISRVTLKIMCPGSMKPVYFLPALFTLGSAALVIASFFRWWFILPLAVYVAALWIDGLRVTRSLKIACLGVAASLAQLYSYGVGFMKSYITKVLLRKGLDADKEVEIRKSERDRNK